MTNDDSPSTFTMISFLHTPKPVGLRFGSPGFASVQEEVQRYEAEVAERQKSLQEMKAGREWPKSEKRIPDM